MQRMVEVKLEEGHTEMWLPLCALDIERYVSCWTFWSQWRPSDEEAGEAYRDATTSKS